MAQISAVCFYCMHGITAATAPLVFLAQMV